MKLTNRQINQITEIVNAVRFNRARRDAMVFSEYVKSTFYKDLSSLLSELSSKLDFINCSYDLQPDYIEIWRTGCFCEKDVIRLEI